MSQARFAIRPTFAILARWGRKDAALVRRHPSFFVSGVNVQCAICRITIQAHDGRVVATRDGLVVHITCADREATVSWARRRRSVLVDGCLSLGVISSLWYVLGSVFGVVAVAAGCALHLLRHWHWWRCLAFRARRVMRIKC